MEKAFFALIASLPLALAGCSRADGGYPSLALRPTEAKGFAEPEAPPAPAIVADPALDASVAQASRSLAAIASGFDRDAAIARAAQGRSGARTTGSDAWIDAQTALAQLDDWRAQASSIASDADGMASARAVKLQPAYPAIETLRAAASAEVARQDTAIRQLSSGLPTG